MVRKYLTAKIRRFKDSVNTGHGALQKEEAEQNCSTDKTLMRTRAPTIRIYLLMSAE